SGKPRVVADDVSYDFTTWRGVFGAAESVLMFQAGGNARGSEIVTYDRTGRIAATLPADHYRELSRSPDGNRLAVTIGDPVGSIWIFDLARGTRTRLSFEPALDIH